MATYLIKLPLLNLEYVDTALKRYFSVTLKQLRVSTDALIINDFDIFNDTITLEDVKDLTFFVSTRPVVEKKKLAIIIGFEHSTQEVQNKLLKTLEEHPTFVDIVLFVEDEGKVIDTIRSRAIIYRLTPIKTSSPPLVSEISFKDDNVWNQIPLKDLIRTIRGWALKNLQEGSLNQTEYHYIISTLLKAQRYLGVNLNKDDIRRFLRYSLYRIINR